MLLAQGSGGLAIPLQLPITPPLPPQASDADPPLGLKLRRQADGVEIVLEGAGVAPQLRQASQGRDWQGRLTTSQVRGVLLVPQQFSLPEAGIQSITLAGGGRDFQLNVVPLQGVQLGRPVVSADGKNLILSFSTPTTSLGATSRPNLNQPGAIPQAVYAPPLQPRATAPPLGDMAVGSMLLRNQSFVNAAGPNVTLTLRNAPAKDALMALAQIGGYGFVFVDDQSSTPSANGATSSTNGAASSGQPAVSSDASRQVTISFRNESYARALNSVLLAAGLQGKLEGRMLLAGPSVLGKSFGPQISKVYRLNQASASSAADYLASLGASISKINVLTATTNSSDTTGTASSSASNTTAVTQTVTSVESYGAATGPLKGLSGTTDSRLQTITLIGDPAQVAVAENYLRQLDLRQRQVALTIQILDVNLNNDTTIDNSFAFKWGNNLILSDSGSLVSWTNDLGLTPQKPQNVPQDANFANTLIAYLKSANTKVLASPTLILSENPDPIRGGQSVTAAVGTSGGASSTASIGRPFSNESFVTVGDQVITNYDFQPSTPTQGAVCKAQLSTAGLTFGARVSKIDDNGFVSFTLSPQISAVVNQVSGANSCGPIDILSVRRLDTGVVRVRDRQTLVLTGVISDEDIQQVFKWPILGDTPIIGQFFRSSQGRRKKKELVIMVTPRIIDDTSTENYGYGYKPGSPEARRMLGASL